jgi:acyl-CoA synthetase (AMP-forming)/AMP-acid ligase II
MRAHPDVTRRDLASMPELTGDGPSDSALEGSPVPGIPRHRSMSELVGNWNGSERMAVDPESGRALPDREEGELWVRGHGVLQGYYKKEREETFDADGWLHTGDRVFLIENQPYFVGRYQEMIKSGGANVSPREVELHLEGWPEIEHALVFGLPHPERGEEVAAVVVCRDGRSLTAEQIRERALVELSSYKVPTRVEIYDHGDDIPWLASGKPDKLQLRARLAPTT